MQYKVLQIRYTDAEVDMINEGVIVRKHTLKSYMSGKRVIPNATKAMELGYYDHVLTIDGTNLEDVFYKGNFAHNHIRDIEVHDSFSSVSVGDVIVDENDWAFVVDTFGFQMLPEKIAAVQ